LQNVVTSNALDTLLQEVETAPLSVLLLDYDGTLAPFHVNRNRAYPYPDVIPLLKEIVRSGKTKVVIISGRPIAELRTFLDGIESLEMWGSHGMERRLVDGSYQYAQVGGSDAELLAEAKNRIVAAGLVSRVETKLGGIAIHWRGMSSIEAKRVQDLTIEMWLPLADKSGLKLLKFEAGLELRVAHPNKGDAVRSVLADLGRPAPIAYLGDDLTDEDAFHVLNGHGVSVLVKDEYRETIAGAWVRPPQQLVDFLERWAGSVAK